MAEYIGDQVQSLLGTTLDPPAPSPEAIERLLVAEQNYLQEPNLENTIWYGRRLAYLFQFERAFDVYTRGIAAFPTAHQLYRHRGHRYISTRQFDRAIADFEQAAQLAQTQPVEIEPDGMPNASNTPLSNTHFNIWYHLGLAYYLTGAFPQAAEAYQTCLTYVYNDDCLTATIDWYVMTLWRMGKFPEAEQLLMRIPEQITLVENDGYYRRLLMYQGKLEPQALLEATGDEDELTLVTQGYGVGNWYLTHGNEARAIETYRRMLTTGSFTAFGYIAAEVDLMTAEPRTAEPQSHKS